jgi:UPF0716 protein FxsA
MRFLFYAVAVGLPILDIATLVEMGRWIGAWPTVGMVLLSATIGVMLVRAQGFAILTQARATLSQGNFPAREVFDGVCVLIGGALLALPGFASDLLGAILLAPPARRLLRRFLRSQLQRSGRIAIWPVGPQPARRSERSGPVIDGEYESVDAAAPGEGTQSPNDDPQRAHSPWRQADAAKVVPSKET